MVFERGLEFQISQAQIHSGSCVLPDWVYFRQETSLHIENEATHGDVFGNPGMRSDFLDLLPGIFLGVLVGEEAHGSRRSISGRGAQFRIQLFICKCRKPAAGMVEKQYLSGSEYTGGNDKLTENILCYRGSAGSDNVYIGLRQTQDSREV